MFRRLQPSQTGSAQSALMGILGDEAAADVQASLAQLRLQVAALEEQMRSQYTSVAAYASIAQEQVEFTRNEARADLDRTRQTLIELVERLRGEMVGPRLQTPGSPPGALAPPVVPALTAPVADRLHELEQAITQCFDRQRELAETVAAVLDMVSAPAAHEPINGLAFT